MNHFGSRLYYDHMVCDQLLWETSRRQPLNANSVNPFKGDTVVCVVSHSNWSCVMHKHGRREKWIKVLVFRHSYWQCLCVAENEVLEFAAERGIIYHHHVDVGRFYIALYSALEHTHCTLVARDFKWSSYWRFLQRALNIHLSSGVAASLFRVTWLVPLETAAISARSMYTIQPCIILRNFMQSHIHRVHTCLAVTSYLNFWQNDRDLLRATGFFDLLV